MKSLLRIGLALGLVLVLRSPLFATEEDCQVNCSAYQSQAAQSCHSGCQDYCRWQTMTVYYNVYWNWGCHFTPSENGGYCDVQGECECDCEYI